MEQVEYVPEALENATDCFVEMLDLEKISRERAEDQVLDDAIETDEADDNMSELNTAREENNNKE